jgi:hypothetical protein
MPATRKRTAKQPAKRARKLADKRVQAKAGNADLGVSNPRPNPLPEVGGIFKSAPDPNDGIEPKDRPLSWWREHWSDAAIRRLFLETFIYVRNAFDQNKLVPMVLNDLQADLHQRVTGRDVILKFRRGGVSRYWLATYLADAVINSGRNVRLVPHDPDTEDEFRADLRMMYEQLPDHLRPATKYYTKDLIWFEDETHGTVDSRLSTATVQPGHEGKGRGQTLTNLLLTEPPHWRGDPKRAATSLMEAAAGGRIAVESTAFGIDWFHSVYQNGKTGKGGWTSHFYEWWWMRHYRKPGYKISPAPGRKGFLLLGPGETLRQFKTKTGGGAIARTRVQARIDRARLTKSEREVAPKILRHLKARDYADPKAKWDGPEVAEYLAWRRGKIEELPGGELQFLVEFPENDRDCFEQTGRPVVPAKFLKVTCDASAPQPGCNYAIGCDPSLGLESGDPAAIQIIDTNSGRQVHEEILKRPPDLLADRLAELSDLYNGADLVVERNGPGIATIRRLMELGYGTRVYRELSASQKRAVEDGRLTFDEAREQAQDGFPTTSFNKPLMGIEIERGLREGYLGLSSQAFCDEAHTVVWYDNGSFGALPGYHDDRFMALAIVWLVIVNRRAEISHFIGVMPETGVIEV